EPEIATSRTELVAQRPDLLAKRRHMRLVSVAERRKLTLDLAEARRAAFDAPAQLVDPLADRGEHLFRASGQRMEQPLRVAGELGGNDPLARRAAQIPSPADRGQAADEPLGRIAGKAPDAVSIVRCEAVMEVVVALPERQQRRHHAVACGYLER